MSSKPLFAVLALLAASPARARPAADLKPDFAAERLTGDWGGLRGRLYDAGFSFDLYYKADAWRNLTGGVKMGNSALDNLDLKMTVDGGKAIRLEGLTALLYLLDNSGGKPNEFAGTNGGIDNIEVRSGSFKVYEAWAQQDFWGDRLSVLLGLRDLNAEFYSTETSGLFLNPTYGIGTEMSATGDNGPSIFPHTSLAARVAVKPTEGTYLRTAVFDGVPGNLRHPKGTHIAFHPGEGLLIAAEGGVKNEVAGHLGVGGWGYTVRRPDQLDPSLLKRSAGFYFLAERPVYRSGARGVDAFARMGFSNGDVGQFSRGWSLGAVFGGFLSARKDGQVGFAVSAAHNSEVYRTLNAAADARETQVELTYKDKLRPWLSIQPDLQYAVHPGTDPAFRNAWTGGLRVGVDF